MSDHNWLTSPARLEALRRLDLLDSGPDVGFGRLTKLVEQVLGVPACLVSLVADRLTPLTQSFCQYVVTSGAPVIVDNVAAYPQACANLAVRDLAVMAYLGRPIRSREGFILGSFCVIDGRPRSWLLREKELLKEFTELLEAELALRATRLEQEVTGARLAKIFAGMSEGVVVQDAQGVIFDNNVAAERILGLTRDQIAGRTSLDPHWRCVRVDGSPFPGSRHPARETLRTGQAQRDVIMGVHRTDGSFVWIEINTELIGAPEDPGRQVVGHFRDVTARRASEERFRALAALAPVGIYQTDLTGACEYVNPAWSALTGLNLAEAAGDGWMRALHPEDRAALVAEWQAFTRGEKEFRHEYRFLRPDGRVTWGSGAAVELRNAVGQVTGYIGTVMELTARQALETNLVQARDKALDASRLKSEFLANMSHEIRTPMNGVIGMTECLLASGLTTEQGEMIRLVQNSAENLLAVINDLLDYAKIEAGKMQLEAGEFSLQALVEETIALFTSRAQSKQLGLGCDFAAEAKGVWLVDGVRWRQVLANLVGNALKFTEQGEVVMTVRVEALGGDRKTVRCEVRDTGIGILENRQGQLFQPFMQMDGSTTRDFGGTGLGLAIARQLVELMGGKIGLRSEPGQGSVFWFSVPLRLVRPAEPSRDEGTTRADLSSRASARPFSPPQVEPTKPVPTSGRRILVVEDNETNQFVARRLLEGLGHEVVLACNGELAVAECLRQKISVILMDCQMPVMDGYTATREIRAKEAAESGPRRLIIALTAYALPNDREKCLAVGMDDYLTKPLRLTQLTEVLQRHGVDFAAAGTDKDAVVAPVVAAVPEPVGSRLDQAQVEFLRGLPGRAHPTLLGDVAELFLRETPAILQSSHEHYEQRSALEFANTMHRLAGSSANLGALAFREAALGLETAARSGDWPKITEGRQALAREWEQLGSTLTQLTR